MITRFLLIFLFLPLITYAPHTIFAAKDDVLDPPIRRNGAAAATSVKHPTTKPPVIHTWDEYLRQLQAAHVTSAETHALAIFDINGTVVDDKKSPIQVEGLKRVFDWFGKNNIPAIGLSFNPKAGNEAPIDLLRTCGIHFTSYLANGSLGEGVDIHNGVVFSGSKPKSLAFLDVVTHRQENGLPNPTHLYCVDDDATQLRTLSLVATKRHGINTFPFHFQPAKGAAGGSSSGGLSKELAGVHL